MQFSRKFQAITMKNLVMLSAISGILALPAAVLAANESTSPNMDSFVDNYIENKLEIGTRIVHRVLTDGDSGAKGGWQGDGTYLGTIYALEEEQNYLPTRLFVSYFFTEYLGVELAYDSMEAETKATSIYTSSVKTDGTVELYGPTLSIIGRYKNDSNFTPYGGIGLGFFSGNFDASPDWTLSYPDSATYEALGSPDTSYNGAYNYMEIDNTVALLLTAGVTWSLDAHWFFDCSMQYIKADADATHTGYHGETLYKTETGSFPMDNFAFRIGVGYSF